MFQVVITLSDMVNALNRIVAQFGNDHKATNPNPNDHGSTCVYAVYDNGVLTPVCIIGQWLHSMGLLGLALDSHSLAETYREGEPSQVGACDLGNDIWARLKVLGIDVEDDAQAFARFAQQSQDNGYAGERDTIVEIDKTWGKVVPNAIRALHAQKVMTLDTYNLAAAYDVL